MEIHPTRNIHIYDSNSFKSLLKFYFLDKTYTDHFIINKYCNLPPCQLLLIPAALSLNRSIVDLQYCVSLRYTAKWFIFICVLQILFHYRSLQDIEYSPLHYIVGPCCLSIFCIVVLLSHFSHVPLCATPSMAAHQVPPSLGFSSQEHWSVLPFPSPMSESEKWKWSRSVVSDPQRPHGLQPSRFLLPWDFPGKSTGVGCHTPLS